MNARARKKCLGTTQPHTTDRRKRERKQKPKRLTEKSLRGNITTYKALHNVAGFSFATTKYIVRAVTKQWVIVYDSTKHTNHSPKKVHAFCEVHKWTTVNRVKACVRCCRSRIREKQWSSSKLARLANRSNSKRQTWDLLCEVKSIKVQPGVQLIHSEDNDSTTTAKEIDFEASFVILVRLKRSTKRAPFNELCPPTVKHTKYARSVW